MPRTLRTSDFELPPELPDTPALPDWLVGVLDEPDDRALDEALNEALQAAARSASAAQSKLTPPNPPPHHLPETRLIAPPDRPPLKLSFPPRPERFHGRKQEITQIGAALDPGRVVTVHAGPGAGKTALAGALVWLLCRSGTQAPERFPDGVFYYSFRDDPSIETAAEALARFFGLEPRPTPLGAAQLALSGRAALLIFDDAETTSGLGTLLDLAARERRARC